jgi:hypothetical protein
MVFLDKRPCVLSHVLLDTDRPPHDILHTLCQYPRYYDSIYYPQYHLFNFQDSDSICLWLVTGLEQHHTTCMSGLRLCLSGTAVQFSEGQFTISVGDLSLQMSVFDIESPVFSFCQLACQFLNLSVSAEWILVGKFVLSQNPSWLTHDRDLYV